MKKNWWKILCMVLLVYALLAGMLLPLSPATHFTDASSTKTGKEISFTITGYNTHYTKAKKPINAWLRKDSALQICADKVEILSDNQLKTTFFIPEKIADKERAVDLTLIVDNDFDGHSVLPGAISVTQLPTEAAMAQNCAITTLHRGQAGTTFPFRNILEETIRNLYYHVPLWFAMMILFLASMILSIMHLNTIKRRYDIYASELARAGLVFGILGLLTGMVWAKHTWGAYWNWDIKQITAAIQLLVYFAYFILRDSFDDTEKKGRISAVYNIFAFATVIPLMFVIPRLASSLHPGSGGNPAFGSNDLDNTMRLVFYPAIIGVTLLGVWMASLWSRMQIVKEKMIDKMMWNEHGNAPDMPKN